MTKLFTLIAAAMMAASVQAQVITFTAGEKPAEGFANGAFKLTYVDTDGKIAVDGNNCYFGTEEAQTKFEARLKTGGKSSSKNNLTATVPSDGVLKICVRTGSNSATDRTLVLTQDETELFNQVVEESSKKLVKGMDESDPEKETSVYPVISVAVKAGDVAITYPVGSMNFYAFEFVSGGEDAAVKTIGLSGAQRGQTYNLAGQKVGDGFRGIAIRDGKKVVMK